MKSPNLAGYRTRKAAQILAHFLGRADAPLEKMKLIKLLYLSEREFLDRYGHPMTYDELYSLPHGPICSNSLDGMNGRSLPSWSDYVSSKGRDVSLLHAFSREDLDEISDAEFEVLESVWEQFGWMTSAQLRNYTHRHCPEYTETRGRIPISYKQILEALGDDEAATLADSIEDMRRLDSLLSP